MNLLKLNMHVFASLVTLQMELSLFFILQNAIIVAEGLPPVTEYRSVIYYHNNKPRWNEMFKVCDIIQ